MEKLARALLGAASGGVLGLLAAGLIQAGLWVTCGLVAGLAVGFGLLNLPCRPGSLPSPPRALLGAILTAAALLITTGVYLFQSAYVHAATENGRKIELPLPIWPVSEKVLWLSVIVAAFGVLLAFLGWAELAHDREKYSGGRWVALAILAGGSAAGLALACYLSGYGFAFGG